MVLLATVLFMVGATAAFGEYTPEEKVLGVGRILSDPTSTQLSSTEKLGMPTADSASPSITASGLAAPITRDVVLNQPAPARPGSTYNLTPGYPSADAVIGEWQTGLASAYGNGFIGNTTNWGNVLTWESMGVAVPQAWRYMMGSYVEIEYGGQSIICFIDDTGAFAQWGRVLDLQPGVWKFFGFNTENDWGVRNVRYRFIG
jgi:rare lipoprotein A (peptidoglycan hydrolase)